MLYPVLLAWAGVCALQDVSQKRIANSLTFSGMAISLGYLLITGETFTGAAPGQAMVAVAMVILLILPGCIIGRMGAGDLKMLLGLALASDAPHVLTCMVTAGVGLGLWTLLSSHIWPCLPARLQNHMPYMAPNIGGGIPYAPFIFLGFLCAGGWV
ncbi:A24 family peptidase [Zobellella aerophila]|uniref:Prepilin type IV endopeptidase peptidase domain-containing protein n=1 Tax=Zobellella aerophila TaxID=870480 RepID=A0ABP6VU60_9GAMM